MQKEIGGYLEFENFSGELLYEDAILLNSARSALRLIIRNKRIKKLWMPYYTCDVILKTCALEKVEVMFYEIDSRFRPVEIDFDNSEWIYVINYFGQLDEYLMSIKDCSKKIIVDNVQSYFSKPVKGLYTIYSCRKYFGVPDGGILVSEDIPNPDIERYTVVNNMTHIIGRYEKNASSYYEDYKKNEERIELYEIKRMSKITENILRAIDYHRIEKIRERNYQYLDKLLGPQNAIVLPANGTFMYPFVTEKASQLRKRMIDSGVYIPYFWEGVLSKTASDFADRLLPLPVDQRYSEIDMQLIVNVIESEMQCQS